MRAWFFLFCVKQITPKLMQPSSSARATIVSAENQNGVTIIMALLLFFFCHYYIVWEWIKLVNHEHNLDTKVWSPDASVKDYVCYEAKIY